MFEFLKRWLGVTATMYQPGTGRIVAARSDSPAGVQVTVETALSIPAFLHGVRTIAQTVGMLEFDLVHHLVAKNADGVEQRQQEIARMHPVHRLLHSEPNEFQNASEWRETMCAHAIATGNGYSYIERNGNYRPTALLPMLPDRTKLEIKNGVMTYWTTVNGQAIPLGPEDVFHIKGFGWTAYGGIPLVQLMNRTLGIDLAQSKFVSAFYGNGTNMGGVVEVAGNLTDAARQNLKSSMHREYGGVGNAFRTLFLEEGMKYTKLGTEPDKAQLIEGRRFSVTEFARVIGLPPHLLYDLTQSTNNNIEHQGIEAVTYCFQPWANKFTQEANRKLLYETEKFDYETRIDTRPLMAGDSAAQAAEETAQFNAMAITPNEIRAKRGRNPIPGGDSVYLNTAILPLGVAIARANAQTGRILAASSTAPAITVTPTPAGDGVDVEADEGDDTPPSDPSAGVKPADGEPGPAVPAKLIEDERAKVLAPVVRDCVARILRRESKATEAALAKFADNSPGFNEWHAKWEQKQRGHIAQVMLPTKIDPADYIESHLAQSRAAIQQILSAEPADRADAQWAVFESWQRDRLDQATKQLLRTP